MIDSGAGDVQIPNDVFLTLARTGTITDADMLPPERYVLADGSTATHNRFLIKKLQVGEQIIYNVSASIGSTEGMLLLGQSFLNKLSGWSIDNTRHVLVLGPSQDIQAASSDKAANVVGWFKVIDNNVRLMLSTSPCKYPKLIAEGYQFQAGQTIPKTRVQERAQRLGVTIKDLTYMVYEDYAQTIDGCWSPKEHKVFWERKQDGKQWQERNYHVDKTWTKFEY